MGDINKDEQADKALKSSQPDAQKPSNVNTSKDSNWSKGTKSLDQPVISPKNETDQADPDTQTPETQTPGSDDLSESSS